MSLKLRKLADKSVDRAKLFNPFTGEAILVEPETVAALEPRFQEVLADVKSSPRPFLGVQIEGTPPKQIKLSERFVAQGKDEGWIDVEGHQLLHRSGGAAENPWARTHTFVHYSHITIKTVDGDYYRYRVVEQPDKWPETKNEDDESGHGGEVRWFYVLKLED